MLIRYADKNDIKTVAEFNQLMAMETENKTLDDATIIQGVSRFIGDNKYGFYLVAEQGDEVVGCLAITFEWSDWRNGLFWWIQSVYIKPAARRSGVFRALYEHVQLLAKQGEDVCGIRLYVEKENTRAQATYLNLGMVETHYRIMEEIF